MPHSYHGRSTFPLCAHRTQTGLVEPSTRRRVSTNRSWDPQQPIVRPVSSAPGAANQVVTSATPTSLAGRSRESDDST